MLNKHAYIDELQLITIPFSEVDEELSNFKITQSLTGELVNIKAWLKSVDRWRYEIYLEKPLEFGMNYTVTANDQLTFDVKIGQVVRTPAFDEMFFYEKADLGVNYQIDSSTFKLWAPTATEVKMVFHNKENKSVFPLAREEKGVWRFTINKNIEGAIYTYQVCVNGIWHEAVDPYAKAVTLNGEHGVVVNLNKTNPDQSKKIERPPLKQETDAIIYELHVRDFSIDQNSGIKHKGKYNALTEINTRGSHDTITGLDYLIDLGITHIQLLPIQDFGSIDEERPLEAYNWGYDTVNFNALEGSYSLDPSDPTLRIKELKKVIHKLHEKGLRVILDVVYNHVYVHSRSNFEKIVPGYYFRYHEDGRLADGTGVGNDIASERLMVRKFIVDSIVYFAKEFHIDGFRFDLMGILDIETMQLVRKKLDEIDESIVVLGEGWDLATPLAHEKKAIIANADCLPGISFFNDQFRDSLKGNIFDHSKQGFCNGNPHLKEAIKALVSGSVKDLYANNGLFKDPYQSINYVECHDNHTLWDKLQLTNQEQIDEVRKKMHRLATAITILSQGVPFLHAGQEFYRTKQGEGNSYSLSDEINKLDWERKAMYEEDVEFVKGLIALRKKYDVFRLRTNEEVNKKMFILDTPSHCLAYMLKAVNGMFVVVFNGATVNKKLVLPANGLWQVFVEENAASNVPIRTIETAKLNISGLTTMVIFHEKVCKQA